SNRGPAVRAPALDLGCSAGVTRRGVAPGSARRDGRGGTRGFSPPAVAVRLLAAAAWLLAAGPGFASEEVDLARWERLSKAGLGQAAEHRYDEAAASFRAAYRLAGGLREEDPRRAATANNLGFVLHAQGRPAEALPLYEEALRLREAGLGPADPLVAQSLNNLAEALRALGRPAEAEPLHRRAVAVRRESLGARHPDAAQSLNNLGVLLAGLGRYDEAEALYREALDVRSAALGADHPAVAETRANFAALAYARGDMAVAEGLYREALAVEEKRLPPGDPGLALTRANLAETLSRQGRPGEAVPLLERVLASRVGLAGGEGRAETAQVRHELAVALAAAGGGDGLARAQELLKESLAARERLSGPESPEVAATLSDLAEVLRRRGQPDAALPHLARVLAIREAAAAKGDGGGTDLAAILNNLALLHFRRGAYLEAEPLLARAVRVEAEALGPDHPDLAVTLENHAAVLLELERREEAEAALHRAKAVRIANTPTPAAQAR
ncbi:MAG TPA: tetratricopeptide repeat protein, partial [Geminicoccaceae bacterium]